jgi:hypothetical protein
MKFFVELDLGKSRLNGFAIAGAARPTPSDARKLAPAIGARIEMIDSARFLLRCRCLGHVSVLLR